MCHNCKPQVAEISHPWGKLGLGKAPYRCVGLVTIPSTSLLEANPTAYNMAMVALPKDFRCGTCHVCGMSLMNNYLIVSTDGHKFVVGCECVLKLGMDDKLSAEVRAQKAKLLRDQRAARRQKNYIDSKRQREEAAKLDLAAFIKVNERFYADLCKYAAQNEFLNSLLAQLHTKGNLSARQIEVALSGFVRIVQYAKDEAERAEFLKKNRFIGNVGDRIIVEAEIHRVIPFDGYDYYTGRPIIKYITILHTVDGAVIKYFGYLNAKASDGRTYTAERGDRINLKGTIKAQEEYKGELQTVVQRPNAVLLKAA